MITNGQISQAFKTILILTYFYCMNSALMVFQNFKCNSLFYNCIKSCIIYIKPCIFHSEILHPTYCRCLSSYNGYLQCLSVKIRNLLYKVCYTRHLIILLVLIQISSTSLCVWMNKGLYGILT